jgi:uncharacterized protein YodC (DUF2158 family)
MATKFKKGDQVQIRQVTPSGPVLALRMDEDGNVYCLLKWVDADGDEQERWFLEDDLIAV